MLSYLAMCPGGVLPLLAVVFLDEFSALRKFSAQSLRQLPCNQGYGQQGRGWAGNTPGRDSSPPYVYMLRSDNITFSSSKPKDPPHRINPPKIKTHFPQHSRPPPILPYSDIPTLYNNSNSSHKLTEAYTRLMD